MADLLAKIIRNFVIWTTICLISAAPSYFWNGGFSATMPEQLAMFAGIGIFVLAYTAVASSPLYTRLTKIPAMKKTLRIGYGTRMAISILVFPAAILDMICGLISGGLSGLFDPLWTGLPDDYATFGRILTWTLIQGLVLNIVLVAYMACVFPIAYAVRKRQPSPLFCEQCQYDLRASTNACPECGKTITVEQQEQIQSWIESHRPPNDPQPPANKTELSESNVGDETPAASPMPAK